MGTDGEESGVVWARVDKGFYVGSLPGRFLGSIDEQADGTFLAMDVYTRPIGTFTSLRLAMTAVQHATIERASA